MGYKSAFNLKAQYNKEYYIQNLLIIQKERIIQINAQLNRQQIKNV